MVDEKLDDLNKIYEEMPDLLTNFAREQNWNFDFRIVFMPQIGYLIRVSPEEEIPESILRDWNEQFANNSGKFYSN